MKTITISDEVYEKLERLKRNKSFSETINKLITMNVALRMEKLLEISHERTGREEELLEVIRLVREGFRVRRLEASAGH
ncbi:MAG: antitoxin VapB family protein [Nitrososphaerales archaeon]